MNTIKSIRRAALLTAALLFLAGSAFSAEQRTTLLVLPFELSSPEPLDYLRSSLSDLLAARIGQDPQVHVYDPAKAKGLLAGRSPLALSPEEITSLAEKSGARYLLLGRLTKLGDPWSIDAALFDPYTNQVIGRFTVEGENLNQMIPKAGELAESIRSRLVLFAKAPPPPPPSVEFRRPSESASVPPRSAPEGATTLGKPWVSQPIPIEIRSIAVADLNGDGRNEIIVLGKTEIRVYQFAQTGLTLLTSYAADRLHEFLYLDAGDLNGNRLAELYVTARTPELISSLVLEWSGRGLSAIASKLPWSFRVVETRQGFMLFGQATGVTLFQGPIRRMAWRGRELTPLESIPSPVLVKIAGVTIGDFDGTNKLMYVDDRNHLLVYDLASRATSSGAAGFGQTNIYMVETRENPEAGEIGFYLPGRVVVDDLGPGQKKMVLAAQNQERFSLLNRLKTFTGGEVVGLRWENQELEELWRTERRGIVADFRLARLVPRGEKMLVVGSVMSFGGILANPESRVVVFSTSALRAKR